VLNNASGFHMPDEVKSLSTRWSSATRPTPTIKRRLGQPPRWLKRLADRRVVDKCSWEPTIRQRSTRISRRRQLFVTSISYTDVKQGMTATATTWRRWPRRREDARLHSQMFTDNGDNTFTVRFFQNGSPTYVPSIAICRPRRQAGLRRMARPSAIATTNSGSRCRKGLRSAQRSAARRAPEGRVTATAASSWRSEARALQVTRTVVGPIIRARHVDHRLN